MESHIRILAILLIVFGALHLIGAFIIGLLGVFGIGIPMVALSSDSMHIGNGGEFAISIVGIVFCILSAYLLFNALLGIVGGMGLMGRKSWSRIFSIVASIFYVTNFPFGTALGVYGLWVLFNDESREWLES